MLSALSCTGCTGSGDAAADDDTLFASDAPDGGGDAPLSGRADSRGPRVDALEPLVVDAVACDDDDDDDDIGRRCCSDAAAGSSGAAAAGCIPDGFESAAAAP